MRVGGGGGVALGQLCCVCSLCLWRTGFTLLTQRGSWVARSGCPKVVTGQLNFEGWLAAKASVAQKGQQPFNSPRQDLF